VQENEYCPSLEDQTNGGCVSGSLEFSEIACGQTVCGTVFSRALVRDVDWYRVVLNGGLGYVCAKGEFPVLLALVQLPDSANCDSMTVVRWAASPDTCPCDSVCFDLSDLPGGTYYLVVTSEVFDCAEMCVDYQLTLNCEERLAVELMGGLNAFAGDRMVSLSWATASETNNDHFDVYRDGERIASQAGAGTTAGRTNYRYVDSGLDNDRNYNYHLVSVDAAGVRSDVAYVSATPTGVSAVATEYSVAQNYPNPFNPTTSITFSLLESGFATLNVYNLMGQEVATLVRGNMAAGVHTVEFDASALPSGMYLYKLTAGSFSATRKMMLMK
jgi:hypothetical protein